MITLRPYQENALDIIMECIPKQEHILVQAATGAGKTIVFCELIKRLLTKWPELRIGILAHRRELITQARDKLITVWPEAPIGIACASVDKTIQMEERVIIGSVQTLVRRTENTRPFDVIIIDEAHKIPPTNKKSQYGKWLKIMREYNPVVRVLGVTATPFRLDHGYIYGEECREGNINLFNTLDYSIPIKTLQKDDYLVKYRGKEISHDITRELQSIKKSAGEYNLGELSDLMSKKLHVGSAVKAVKQYAEDRKHIVVFCVTIKHAEIVRDAFEDAEFATACVHSKMSLGQRDMILNSFASGDIRVLANVMVLSEGWDSPHTDCILMCRPTQSAGLFVQMTGRGLRPYDDKKDVLILDLAGNFQAHGDPNEPKVVIPGKGSEGGSAPVKICPNCDEILPAAINECPYCGHEFPRYVINDNEMKAMKDVTFEKEEPIKLVVTVDQVYFDDFTSRKGNRMLRVQLICTTPGALIPKTVNNYMDFEANGSEFGQKKAIQTWQMLTKSLAPKTVAEGMSRRGQLEESIPPYVEIIDNKGWWNVSKWFPPPPATILEKQTTLMQEEIPF